MNPPYNTYSGGLKNKYNDTGIKIKSATDIYKLLRGYGHKNQEYFITISIDGSNSMIRKRVLFIGTLNRSLVHPREIFRPAIEHGASAIIIAHNHPSGTLKATPEDFAVTQKIKEAGDLLGIELLDHLIISKNKFISLL